MARVLVIEDEPRLANFLSRGLRAEGLPVDCAGDGARGLERALTGRYSLVILDLLLPGIDGFGVLQEIMDSNPEQRVMVLSALSDVDTKVRCLELGASDYLQKPFALKELVARVRARLRQPAVQPLERFLRVGPVTLDTVRRVAEVNGRQVELTERQFLLLSHLMRAEGEVCTREELQQGVWGTPFATSSNVVDVYVARLRRKLGGEAIETVRNVGYRVAA